MKYLSLFAFSLSALLAFSAGDSSSEENLMDLLVEAIPDEYKDKINKDDPAASMEGYLLEVGKAVCAQGKTLDAKAIIAELSKRVKAVEKQKDTICGLVKKNLMHVMEPLYSGLDNCVDDELKGALKKYVIAVSSLIEHTCQMNGEHLIELTNPCLQKVDPMKCFPEVDSLKETFASKDAVKIIKTLNKKVCPTYQKGRDCLEKEIKTHCKLAVTKESAMGLMDAGFTTPCKA